jgi:hypothetical protein
MKHINLFFLLILFGSSSMSAQTIPNSGFETWNGPSPVGWDTVVGKFGGAINKLSQYTYSIDSNGQKEMRTAYPHEGSHFIRLMTDSVFENGQWDAKVSGIFCRFPVSKRPKYFNFSAAYFSAPGFDDEFFGFGIVVSRYNQATKRNDTLFHYGYGYRNCEPWKQINFNMQPFYTSTAQPDTIAIFFASSIGRQGQFQDFGLGSTLLLDDLSFSEELPVSDIAPANQPQEISVSEYPNPFDDHTTLTYALEKECRVKVRLLDMTGRLISVPEDAVQSGGLQQFHIEKKGLKPGLYFYQIEAGGKSHTGKLIIN